MSCFSRQLQSSPPTNVLGNGPATSQHDRGFSHCSNTPCLSSTHVCAGVRALPPSFFPLGPENTSLTSTLASKKGSDVCLVDDAVSADLFQTDAFKCGDSRRHLVHSRAAQNKKKTNRKRLETTSTKGVFPPQVSWQRSF